MTTSSTRRRRVVLGVAILVVGLVAAAALWLAGGDRRDRAVEDLARAPVGCDTTLDFADTGRFHLFIETTGTFTDVAGDCDASGDYDVDVLRPAVDVTVIDPDGEQLTLEPSAGEIDYATAGFVGRSVLSVDVEVAADHVIRVEASGGSRFAVAVGRDPDAGVLALRAGAFGVGLAAVVLGLVLLLARRTPSPTTAPAGPTPWPHSMPAPTQPLYRPPVPSSMTPPSGPPIGSPHAAGPSTGGGSTPSGPPAAPPGPTGPQASTAPGGGRSDASTFRTPDWSPAPPPDAMAADSFWGPAVDRSGPTPTPTPGATSGWDPAQPDDSTRPEEGSDPSARPPIEWDRTWRSDER